MANKQLIPSLNGLRAVSIMMVIFFHFRTNHFFDFENPLAKQIGLIFINGELGVNIFFIISGFLITTLLIKEINKTGSISLKDFYIKRTFRIFPAYYALLLIYFVLECFHYFNLTTTDWLSVILYGKQFVSSDVHEIGHLWSLSVEEVFYLVYPFLFIRFHKNIRTVILLLIPVFVFIRFYGYAYPTPGYKNTIFTTGDSLLIGCLLAFENDRIKSFILRYKYLSLAAFPLLVGSITILLGISSVFNHSSNKMLLQHPFVQNFAYAFFGNIGLVTNILVAYIILMSINLRNWWFTFLNNPVLNYIGMLSYSIYLWQQLFTAERAGFQNMGMLVILTIIFVAAFLTYNLIEKPFLQLREKVLNKKPAKNISSVILAQ